MTNEERAREAAEKITKASDRYELGRLGLEQIILAALDAATAPLVAERERLREEVERLRGDQFHRDIREPS